MKNLNNLFLMVGIIVLVLAGIALGVVAWRVAQYEPVEPVKVIVVYVDACCECATTVVTPYAQSFIELTDEPVVPTNTPEPRHTKEPTVTPPTATPPPPTFTPTPEPTQVCKPGWGYGDKNHCHTGPPKKGGK